MTSRSGSARALTGVAVRAIALAATMALSACAGLSRDDYALEDRTGAAPVAVRSDGEIPVRYFVDDPARITMFQTEVERGLQVGADGRFDVPTPELAKNFGMQSVFGQGCDSEDPPGRWTPLGGRREEGP